MDGLFAGWKQRKRVQIEELRLFATWRMQVPDDVCPICLEHVLDACANCGELHDATCKWLQLPCSVSRPLKSSFKSGVTIYMYVTLTSEKMAAFRLLFWIWGGFETHNNADEAKYRSVKRKARDFVFEKNHRRQYVSVFAFYLREVVA